MMAAQPLGSLGSSADRNLLAVALKMGEHMRAHCPPSTSPRPAHPPAVGIKLAPAVRLGALISLQHLDI